MDKPQPFYHRIFETPMGNLWALADPEKVHVLAFHDQTHAGSTAHKIWLRHKEKAQEGGSAPLLLLQQELEAYFAKELTSFQTPYSLEGTDFQKRAWAELLKTPYGKTRSYKEQAMALGSPLAVRAVGSANGANPLVLILPCHRIISSHGGLGGYGGGLKRKQWLLSHEGS